MWRFKGRCASAQEKIEEKVKKLNIDAAQLLAMNDQQIRERFHNVDFVVKLREKIEKEEKSALTEAKLSKYKMCPKCRAPIDKYEGYYLFYRLELLHAFIIFKILSKFIRCNKVTCICGAIMCYICGKQITGYEHFNATGAKCNLWSGGAYGENIAGRVMERQMHEVN